MNKITGLICAVVFRNSCALSHTQLAINNDNHFVSWSKIVFDTHHIQLRTNFCVVQINSNDVWVCVFFFLYACSIGHFERAFHNDADFMQIKLRMPTWKRMREICAPKNPSMQIFIPQHTICVCEAIDTKTVRKRAFEYAGTNIICIQYLCI